MPQIYKQLNSEALLKKKKKKDYYWNYFNTSLQLVTFPVWNRCQNQTERVGKS